MNLPPAVWRLIDLAIDEDLGRGDVTSAAIFNDGDQATGYVQAKSALVLSGLDVAMAVLQRVEQRIGMRPLHANGAGVSPGTVVLELTGPVRGILAGERTALNFLQRLSGVATLTSSFVQAVAGTGAEIVDTRKTAPGFRWLDKRAVRHGGGSNHRADLGSGVLIKDNHVAAAGGVTAAVRRARQAAPHTLRIEVEVTTLGELAEAVTAGADIVLLDNMDPALVRQAVGTLAPRGAPQRPLIEVSGGITLDTVRAYAEAGADLISVGALTHSVRAQDLSLEVRPA